MFRVKSFVGALVFSVAASGTSHPSAGDPACPAGTRPEGSSCVLDSDLVLAESLDLRSFTRLNCRGQRILPSSVGSGTTAETYVASVPALAIAITGDRGVDIRNCIIGDNGARFDFGIIAVNGKTADRFGHRIHDNEIHARDSAITLLSVDEAQVNNNVITWTNGYGILLARDSDRNRINNNILSSLGSVPTAIRLVPDGQFRNAVDDAISLTAFHLLPLFNLVVAGRLYQFPNSEDGQYASQEDNVITGNRVTLPGASAGKTHTGIGIFNNAARSRVIGNTIAGAGTGIRLAGNMPSQPVSRAGRCVNAEGQETPRFCETDADCFIPAIDAAPIGTCPALPMDVRDLRALDTVVGDNTLVGPFNATAIAMRAAVFGGNGTVGGIIRDNQIRGTGTEAGISLAGNMVETGRITGNVVEGVSVGLLLQQGPAAAFGARVFLNDIANSTTQAIGILGPYTLASELSWDGAGNYWGHSTPPCFRLSDTPIPGLIQDSYAFCSSVVASSRPSP